MQWPAAITLVGGEPQMIDEHGKRGEREMLGQNDADTKRDPRCGQRGMRFLRTAWLSH
jgi:hypothetical protein